MGLRPVFIPISPPPPDLKEGREGETDAFKAATITTHFGTELMKFFAPERVALIANDPVKGITAPYYQGFLANNFAWWTDAHAMSLRPDSQNFSSTLPVPARNFIPGVPEFPDQVTNYFADDNDVHGTWADDATTGYFGHGRFNSLHQASAIIGSLWFEGGGYGRLNNINPFRGVSGGFSNSTYNMKNTWNAFEVYSDQRSEWDYGVSSGYNSSFAVDVGDGTAAVVGDWDKLNTVLSNISRQAILMKDNHFGFNRNSGFHQAVGPEFTIENPFSGTWNVDSAHPDLWEGFGSGGAHPYVDDQIETQAPNYFEIIQSGAWAKWVKNKDLSTETAIRDSTTIATGTPDGEKFYYFLKSLLESKRRVLEAYRRVLGPAKFLPMEAPAGSNLSGVQLDTAEYANVPTGAVGRVMAGTASAEDWDHMLKTTRRQTESIQDWYEKVAKTTDPTASFYNMLLFEAAHTVFGTFDTLSYDTYAATGEVDKTSSGGVNIRMKPTGYTEAPEAKLFERAAIKSGFKYMIDEMGLGALSAAPKTQYDQYVATLRQERDASSTSSDRRREIERHLQVLGGQDGNSSGVGKAVREAQDAYDALASESTDVTANNHIEIKRKLEALYQKQFAVYEETLKVAPDGSFPSLLLTMRGIRQKAIKALNATAPVAELLRSASRDRGVDKMRTPVLGFDSVTLQSRTGLDELTWDFIPHGVLTSDNTNPMYDGYVTMPGTGVGYAFGLSRRMGPVMIAERPPVLDQNGLNLDASGMITTTVPSPDGNEYAITPISGENYTIQSVAMDRAFSPKRLEAYYVHSDARGHLMPAAQVAGYRRWRGQEPEIFQNPAFSAAAFTYQSRQGVAEEQVMTQAYNWSRQSQYRHDVNRYEEREEARKEEEYNEQRAYAEESARAREAAQSFEAARQKEKEEREFEAAVQAEKRRREAEEANQ